MSKLPIDTHSHLTDFQEVPNIIKEAKEKLSAVFTCGYSMETSVAGADLAKANPGFIYAIAGDAPQRVMENPNVELLWLEELEGIVAVGEIGLDMHWGKTDNQLKNQKRWFESQLCIAEKRGLPVVIHSRDAESEVLDILESHALKGVLLHCFSGKMFEAKRGVDKGYLISIPPTNSKTRRKIIKSVDIEYLLLESDSPYIGKNPWSVIDAARSISELKGLSLGEVSDITARNAINFYGVERYGYQQTEGSLQE
ncbi:MAG: TatD family hydrolase [Candidatus Micrarchaeota archaeon]